MPNYINIHKHHIPDHPQKNIFEIINLHENFDRANPDVAYSMGIHPWYITDVAGQMKALKQYSISNNVKAIGECGLDKVCTTDWSLQEQVFKQQIEWANALKKPLIIHCVRAYTEVLTLLREATVPVIFHGFNKKKELAEEIVAKGHYLSFGAAIMKENSIAGSALAMVPADRFFLETDDQTADIEDVYKAAAIIRKTGEDVIILQLQQNYKNVFGI